MKGLRARKHWLWSEPLDSMTELLRDALERASGCVFDVATEFGFRDQEVLRQGLKKRGLFHLVEEARERAAKRFKATPPVRGCLTTRGAAS